MNNVERYEQEQQATVNRWVMDDGKITAAAAAATTTPYKYLSCCSLQRDLHSRWPDFSVLYNKSVARLGYMYDAYNIRYKTLLNFYCCRIDDRANHHFISITRVLFGMMGRLTFLPQCTHVQQSSSAVEQLLRYSIRRSLGDHIYLFFVIV